MNELGVHVYGYAYVLAWIEGDVCIALLSASETSEGNRERKTAIVRMSNHRKTHAANHIAQVSSVCVFVQGQNLLGVGPDLLAASKWCRNPFAEPPF